MPDASALPERLDTVAQTAYLAFAAGYSPGSGADLLRAELSGEAIRLVRVTMAVHSDEPVPAAGLSALEMSRWRRVIDSLPSAPSC